MKIVNPFYILLGIILLTGAALANHHGWSLPQALASRAWQHGAAPNTQHK